MIKCPVCKGSGSIEEIVTLSQKRKSIYKLRDKGYSIRKIAALLGISRGTAHYHIQRRK